MKKMIAFLAIGWSSVCHGQILDTVYNVQQPWNLPIVYEQPDSSKLAFTLNGKQIMPDYGFGVIDLKNFSFSKPSVGFSMNDNHAVLTDSVMFRFGDEYDYDVIEYINPSQMNHLATVGQYDMKDVFLVNDTLVGHFIGTDPQLNSYGYFATLGFNYQPVDTVLSFYFGLSDSSDRYYTRVPKTKPPLFFTMKRVNPGGSQYNVVTQVCKMAYTGKMKVLFETDTFLNSGVSQVNFNPVDSTLIMASGPFGAFPTDIEIFDFEGNRLFKIIPSNFSNCENSNFKLFSVFPDNHGNYIVLYGNGSPPLNSSKIRNTVFKFGPTGELIWQRCITSKDLPDSTAQSVSLDYMMPLGDTAYAFLGRNFYDLNDYWCLRFLVLDTAGTYASNYNFSLEEDVDLSFKVYPNPVIGALTIEHSSEEMVQVVVLDVSGRVMLSKEISSHVGQIDMNGLDAGIYVIHIKTSDNQGYISRFVKQ